MNKDKIYLVQTDTTVGFLSANDKSLSVVKQRDVSKKILRVVDSFQTLKTNTRVPKAHKKMVRRAKKTTFIYPNLKSFRVIFPDNVHHNFVKKFNTLYSTSANLSGFGYDEKFAKKNADILVMDNRGYNELIPSSIYKLGKKTLKKIR